VTARSIVLFIAAAIAEIGGAYLVWVGVKDHKGIAFIALGAMALTAYGVVAAFQPSHEVRASPRRLRRRIHRRLAAVGRCVRRVSTRPLRPHRRRHLPDRRRGDHVRALSRRDRFP
jgi:hypothetical protein